MIFCNIKIYTAAVLMFLSNSVLSHENAESRIAFWKEYYNPKIETSDPIPKIGFIGKNLLLNWGMRYQIYPNVRIGYIQSHSLHFGEIGTSNYIRNISYRSFSFETFYLMKEKMEFNFSLAPMLNKGSVTITATAPTSDWDSFLSAYGNGSVSLKTGSSMTKSWIGFSSHVGYRYYFSRLLSAEASLGYYMSSYSDKNWILEGKINCKEDMQEGFENAPSTLRRLFESKNKGKQLLKIAD